MKLAEELIRFGQQLAEQNNAASDLWTWLPSHTTAKKHHGDHAYAHCPSNRDVMLEASLYLASMRRADKTMTVEEKEWFTRCPCGEDHT
jgi:hypothetical protein